MAAAKVEVFADAEAVSRAAAEAFVRAGREATTARGRYTVVLSGGSTPQRMYQLLTAAPLRDAVDWSRVEFFWGDERAVPPDHKDSNFHAADVELLQKVPVPKEHIFRVVAEQADRSVAAREYQTAIARSFGVSADGPPPAFDLVFLGMGPDGHTASLFPGNAALAETTKWVVPVDGAPKPPPARVSLTPTILNAARAVLFLAAGADKADRLREVLEGPYEPDRLPSQRIRPTNGTLGWYVDRAAATHLSTAKPAQE
jgi:6-phosphogluconolactonase